MVSELEADVLLKTSRMAGIIGSLEATLEIVQIHFNENIFDKNSIENLIKESLDKSSREFQALYN